MGLDQARAEAVAAGTSGDGGRVFYVDVGNSIHAVNELAFVAMPPDGLRVGLLEVAATLPAHPMHSKVPLYRRVVLLRRPPRGQDADVHVEPVLIMIIMIIIMIIIIIIIIVMM